MPEWRDICIFYMVTKYQYEPQIQILNFAYINTSMYSGSRQSMPGWRDFCSFYIVTKYQIQAKVKAKNQIQLQS